LYLGGTDTIKKTVLNEGTRRYSRVLRVKAKLGEKEFQSDSRKNKSSPLRPKQRKV